MNDQLVLVISPYQSQQAEGRRKVFWPDVLELENDLSPKLILDICATIIEHLKSKTDAICQILSGTDEYEDFLQQIDKIYNFTLCECLSWNCLETLAQTKNCEFGARIFEVSVDEHCMKVNILEQIGKGYRQISNCINELTISEEDLCCDDKFNLKPKDLDKLQIQESKPESPVYYPDQENAAAILIERIKYVLKRYLNHPEGMEFSKYTNFDFQIYTARSNLLEAQTIKRLSQRLNGCFKPKLYDSPKELEDWAKERVRKYISTKAAEEHLRELKDKISNNKNTFFLIVADEAHWGITNSGSSDQFTNAWGNQNYKNVVVLLVTATPWNLLTSNSRIPETYIAVQKQSEEKRMIVVEERMRGRLFSEVGADITNSVGPKKELHVMKWTEIYDDQLAEGLLVSLKIPLKDKFLWLHIEENDAGEIERGINIYKWKASENKDKKGLFLFKKTPNGIEIHSFCRTYMLVSNHQRNGKVGFILTSQLDTLPSQNYYSTFEVVFNFGEDVFEIRSSPDQYLHFDSRSSYVTSGRTPPDTMTVIGLAYHSLNYSFIFDSKQKPGDICLEKQKQYISLNFYYNSMRNSERMNRLIREDELFQTIQKKCKIDYDTLLAVDYAYHILLISINNMDQANVSAQTLAEFFGSQKPPENFCKDYLAVKKDKMQEFIKELQDAENNCENFLKPISCKHFQKVCNCLDDFYYRELLSSASDLSKRKNHTYQDSGILANDLIKYIFYANCESFAENIHTVCGLFNSDDCKKKLELISRNLNTPFSKLFADGKIDILSESETFLIVYNLVQTSRSDLGLCGKMKVVRISNKTSGNCFYATLIAARKVAQNKEHLKEHFEVIRYFDKLKLDSETNAQSVHRIWQILQHKDCEFKEKRTYRRCCCRTYRPSNDNKITCKECGHKHFIVNHFSDLEHLPCILILVDKGKLGDTFPPSFNTMDLRACHNSRAPALASVMQELGRMCRYDVKADLTKLPYALVGREVMKRLQASLHESAVFTSCFNKIDIHAKNRRKSDRNGTSFRPQIDALESSYDYNNKETFPNRLLLQAEPQIGKTGVFLKTISLLRRMICGGDEVCETEGPEFDMATDDEEESGGDSDDDDDESTESPCYEDDDWKYPYWKDMRNGKKLKDIIESSKYSSIYGPYVHNVVPQYMQLRTQKRHKPLKSNSDGCRLDSTNKDKFRAFSYQEHNHMDSCIKCQTSAAHTVEVTHINVAGQKVKISIPLSDRFQPIVEKLQTQRPDTFQTEFPNYLNVLSDDVHDQHRLNTWIFHPSYGRSEVASVNYRHTMVRRDIMNQKFRYIQILVVRREEFDAYSSLWQKTHVLLELPSTFDNCDVDVDMGGIGFARLFIQHFAEEFGLSKIFILDDNIYKMHQLITKNSRPTPNSAAADAYKSRVLIEVPIFEALKHLESQFICASAPKSEFDHYPKSICCKGSPLLSGTNLHQFTGPSEIYGILGVLRFRPNAKNVKCGFRKTHVCSLVLLNIESLREKKIRYRPWQVHEDLNLNNDCDSQNLIVCKYNQYLMCKKQMKTWIPEIYEWSYNDTLTLNKELGEADGSGECLLRWIRTIASPKCLNLVIVGGNELVPHEHYSNELSVQNQDQLCLKIIFTGLSNVKLGKCHVVGFMKRKNSGADDLLSIDEYFRHTCGIGGFSRHVVILPVDICKNLSLTTSVSFEKKFGPLFHRETKIKVFTSHNIQSFRNALIAVLILGRLNCAADKGETKNCGINSSSSVVHYQRVDSGINTETNFNHLKRTAAEPVVSEKQSKTFKGAAEFEVIPDSSQFEDGGNSKTSHILIHDTPPAEDEMLISSDSDSSQTSESLLTGILSLELDPLTGGDAAELEAHSDSSQFEDGDLSKTSHIHDRPPEEDQILISSDSDSSQTSVSLLKRVPVSRIPSDLVQTGLISDELNDDGPEWDVGITDEEFISCLNEFEKDYYASTLPVHTSPATDHEIISVSSGSDDIEAMDSDTFDEWLRTNDLEENLNL